MALHIITAHSICYMLLWQKRREWWTRKGEWVSEWVREIVCERDKENLHMLALFCWNKKICREKRVLNELEAILLIHSNWWVAQEPMSNFHSILSNIYIIIKLYESIHFRHSTTTTKKLCENNSNIIFSHHLVFVWQ